MDFKNFYETYRQDVDYLKKLHCFDTSYMQLRVFKMKVFFIDNYKKLRKSAIEQGCYSEFISLLRESPELCSVKKTENGDAGTVPPNDRKIGPDWPDDE